MTILQTNVFYKAVQTIVSDPFIGEKKKGDLKDVYVYKFCMVKKQMLLAYTYQKKTLILTLLTFGFHENFYSRLKKSSRHIKI